MLSEFLLILNRISSRVIPLLGKEILYSSIIFVVIFAFVTLCKKISLRWQLGLWTLILLRLILPPDFSHSLSGRTVLEKIPGINQAYRVVFNFFSDKKLNLNEGNFPTGLSFEEDSETFTSHEIAATTTWSKNRVVQTILFTGWLLGVIVFFLHYLKRLRRFQKMLKQADPVQDSSVQQLVQNWRSRFKIRRQIRVKSSEHYLSPFTLGIFRPVIYLPQSVLETRDSVLLQSIIAHEMTHIKRLDDLWIKVQNLIQILYFFHPVVWLTNSRINLLRECVCDSVVLSQQEISAKNYGHGIMAILKLNLLGSDGIGLLPGFGSHRKKLTYRLQNLNGGHIMKKQYFFFIYGSLIVLGLFLLPMASNVVQSMENETSNPSSSATRKNNSDKIQKKDINFAKPIHLGKVSAGYGDMKHPFKKKVVFHTGVDIAVKLGTEIYAAANGTVIKAATKYEKNKGAGKQIWLKHENGYQTRYTHLNEILVKEGQKVNAGELIAQVGSTGLSTGPHLHFEIRLNEKSQDPENYIDFKDLTQ